MFKSLATSIDRVVLASAGVTAILCTVVGPVVATSAVVGVAIGGVACELVRLNRAKR